MNKYLCLYIVDDANGIICGQPMELYVRMQKGKGFIHNVPSCMTHYEEVINTPQSGVRYWDYAKQMWIQG